MRKFIFILLAISLSAGGYFLYQYWLQVKGTSIWSLVPERALIVYENSQLMATWEELQSSPVWENLSRIEAVGLMGQRLESLDSMMAEEGAAIDKLTSQNPLLISLHVTSKNQFDFLYQVELKNIESHSAVFNVMDQLGDLGFTSSKRTYLGHTLTEIRKDNKVFTYIFLQNFFVGSFTSFLVEDVIRTANDTPLNSFENNHQELFSLVKLQNDEGNLYVNSARIGNLLDVFTDDLKLQSSSFNGLISSTFLDLSIDEENISMSGFSIPRGESTYLSTFNENPAATFEMASMIPDKTATFQHISTQNMSQWNESLMAYWTERKSPSADIRSQIKSQYDVDLSQYFRWISGEIGLVDLAINQNTEERITFIKVSNAEQAASELNQLAERSKDQSDSIHYQLYDDIRITQIYVPDLPLALFGKAFDGFEQSFYTIQDDHVIIGNSPEAIKNWLNEYRDDNTWGKSIKTIQFLESTLKEANYSYYINTNQSWRTIRDHLTPDWLRFSEENSNTLRRIEMSALQFSYIDGKYYTSLVLNQPGQIGGASSEYVIKNSIEFAAPLITKPHIVRNHTNRDFETLVQDSLNNVYLVSADAEVLWTDSLSQPIVSDVFQVDMFKNGKLQYLFATENQLHVIDRNGDHVSPFPLSLNGLDKVDYLSLVDYDRSKRYRFMVTDDKGNIFLYDKNGINLDGWKPRNLNGPLSSPAFHRRIRTRDRMVAIQKDGVVNVMNRVGRMTAGFPIDLKAPTSSTPFVSLGSSFENSQIVTITDDGEIVAFNLSGQILKRDQLYKPLPDTKFATLPDELNQSYLFVRKSGNQLAVLDENGEALFEKDYLSSENLSWQYYNFGGNKEVIIIVDKDQEFAYLYKRNGELINYQPLEANQAIGLLYYGSTDKFELYKVHANQLSIIEFDYQ